MNGTIRTRDIPITAAAGFPPGLNGVIHCFGQNPEGIGKEHIFSFVFYYTTKGYLPMEKTEYFQGLQAYIEMVHDSVHAPYFALIVYTNTLTAKLFQNFFPLERYPNLILAIPEWPLYTTHAGDLDSSVLRTMRYQAVEAFPYANVHMRDADTLFVSVLYKLSPKEFYELVRDWEDTYLRGFLAKVEALGKQIVLGTHAGYKFSYFHKNLIYPVDFTFPLNIYGNSGYTTFPVVPKNSAFNPKFPYEKYKVTFERKYMYGYDEKNKNQAVLAGFSTILKNRSRIENFWTICVEYMVQRYRMTRNSISNEFHTKSIYTIGKDERMLIYGIIPRFFDKIFFMEINYIDSLGINIKSRKDIEELKKHYKNLEIFSPSYFEKVPLNIEPEPTKPNTYPSIFYTQVQNYEKWLAAMKGAYPTEEAFLNSINTNISKALTPEEFIKLHEDLGYTNLAKELKEDLGNASRQKYAKFIAAGRKATVRRGGGALKKRRSKTQKKRGTQ